MMPNSFKLVTDELAFMLDSRTDAITRAWSRVCHSIVSGWKHSGKVWDTTDNCALTNRPHAEAEGSIGRSIRQPILDRDRLRCSGSAHRQNQGGQGALLMVLKHPEIPLHNNPAELDARSACESVW